MPATLLQRWRDGVRLDILDGIGTTEMLHIFISNRPGRRRDPGTSGTRGAGLSRCASSTRRAAKRAADAIGDLEVRGDSAVGRLLEVAANNRAQRSATSWVRTGDKYLRRPSGHLVYCGRRDDLLKVGGIYVSPMEVENALLAHPAVIEAAVVGAEDADKLIKPKAIVVRANSPSPALADELIAHVRSRLGRLQTPALDRVRRRTAEDRDRKDPALQAAMSARRR